MTEKHKPEDTMAAAPGTATGASVPAPSPSLGKKSAAGRGGHPVRMSLHLGIIAVFLTAGIVAALLHVLNSSRVLSPASFRGMGDISPQNIRSITFLDSKATAPVNSLDISELRDGSVLLWAAAVGRDAGTLYDVTIAADGGVIAPANCENLFQSFTALEAVYWNGAFDTSRVKNMHCMFQDCGALSKLDLQGLDTSAVTTLSGMFQNCGELKELLPGGLDTSSVTDMSWMFYGCGSLTSLDLQGLDTSAVKDMSWMFSDCVSLRELDLGRWNTGAVTNMYAMFNACSSLKKLDLNGWNTRSVREMSWMFNACSSLELLDIRGFDMSRVTGSDYMFNGVPELSILR